MKNFTLTLLMLVSSITYGQLFTVSACSNLGSTTYGPMYSVATANATSRTAVIYPASEIVGISGQELTALYFKRSTATGTMGGSPYFRIYLKEVSAADWGAGALEWDVAVADATLVFAGDPAAFIGSSAGWINFPLSTNFNYTGTQNLVVMTEYRNLDPSTSISWNYEYTAPCVDTSNSNTTKYSNNTTGILATSLASSNFRRPLIGFDFSVTCPAPTDFVFANLTATTVDLTWTAGGAETSWEYAVLPASSPSPTSGTVVSSAEALGVTVLPNTDYIAYVRAICGTDDESVWITTTFTTPCEAIVTLPWTENFDALASVGTNSYPPCWFEENGAWASTSSTTYNTPLSGDNYIRNADSATDEFIWTPGFALVAGTSYDFSAFVQGDNYTGWVVDMHYNSEAVSTGATQLGTSYIVPGSSPTGPAVIQPYVEMRRTFVPSTTGTYYFGIRVNHPSFSAQFIAFDNFSLELTPDCAAPSDFVVSNLTSNSADLEWTENGSSTEWNIEYGPAGFTPGTGTLANNVTSPYSISGLDPNSAYSYYVQSDCGDSVSAWGGPMTFTTPCAAEMAPTAVETFTNYVPACWAEATGAIETSLSMGTSAWNTSSGFANTGTDAGTKINLYGGSTASPDNDWIISNSIDLGATPGVYQLRYRMAVTSWNGTTSQATLGTHTVQVVVSTDNGVTWTTANVVKTYTGAGTYSNTGTDEFVSLAGYTGVVKIGFLATTMGNSPDVDFHIDDFVVETIPSCAQPSSITVTDITTTSAVLGWTENGSATTWNIEYGPTGFTPGAGTMVTVTENPYTLTGLDTATAYQFYLQSDCGATDSPWSSATAFSTLATPPANDNCDAAVALTVNPDFACAAITSGTTLGATESMASTPCFGNPDDDVWFSFVAENAAHRIVLSNIVSVSGSTSTDMYMQILSGACGSLTSVQCSDPNTMNVIGLTVGTTYFVRVYSYYATARQTFDICVGTPPPPPSNDECVDATALVAGGVYADNVVDATSASATGSSEPAPTTCFGYSGGDVWFTAVVPASGNLTIETGAPTTGTGVDTVVTAYSGTCGTLTQIGCDDDGAATGSYSLLTVTGQAPGSTIFVRVYEYSNDNAGAFAISVYDASLSTNSFTIDNFDFYPNPVQDVLRIKHSGTISQVSVFNVLGQQVINQNANSTETSVDMSALPAGVYVVKATADGAVKSFKIIKE